MLRLLSPELPSLTVDPPADPPPLRRPRRAPSATMQICIDVDDVGGWAVASRARSGRRWRAETIVLILIWIAVAWVVVTELREGGLDRPTRSVPATTTTADHPS